MVQRALLLLIFVVLVFTGCKKEIFVQEASQEQNEIKPYTMADSLLTLIAQMHNDYLLECLSRLDFNEDRTKSFIKAFYSVNMDGLDFLQKKEIITELTSQKGSLADVNKFLYAIDTCYLLENKSYIKKIIAQSEEIFNIADTADYTAIKQKVDRLINLTKSSNLSANEQAVLLTYLKTLEYSAYCWLPQERGGSGLGYKFLTNDNEKDKVPAIGAALISDCSSAGIGMIGIAVFGAITGGVGAIAVIEVAANAVASSGLAGALQAGLNHN